MTSKYVTESRAGHDGAFDTLSTLYIVSFPDPAFKLDKGLAHFARNLGLPDWAGKE